MHFITYPIHSLGQFLKPRDIGTVKFIIRAIFKTVGYWDSQIYHSLVDFSFTSQIQFLF